MGTEDDALADELFAVFRNEVAGHEMDPETATRDGIYAIVDHLVAQGHMVPEGADVATHAVQRQDDPPFEPARWSGQLGKRRPASSPTRSSQI